MLTIVDDNIEFTCGHRGVHAPREDFVGKVLAGEPQKVYAFGTADGYICAPCAVMTGAMTIKELSAQKDALDRGE